MVSIPQPVWASALRRRPALQDLPYPASEIFNRLEYKKTHYILLTEFIKSQGRFTEILFFFLFLEKSCRSLAHHWQNPPYFDKNSKITMEKRTLRHDMRDSTLRV